MAQQSAIRTSRVVDQPIALSSGYRANAIDRSFIDEQIRATQQHIVDDLINGVIATWFILDGSSVAVVPGDVVCGASNALATVTKSSAADLSASGMGCGVVMAAAAPGSPVRVAEFGRIAQSTGITGLATSNAGPVRINTTSGHLERVASLANGDYPAGYVDSAGNFTIGFFQVGIAGGGGAAIPTGTGIPHVVSGAYQAAATLIVGADIAQMGATTGQFLQWNGSTWAPANSPPSATYSGLNADKTITETKGETYVGYAAMSATHTVTFPNAPSDGFRVIVGAEDLVSLASWNINLAATGADHFRRNGADSTTYAITIGTDGNGAFLTWRYAAAPKLWILVAST